VAPRDKFMLKTIDHLFEPALHRWSGSRWRPSFVRGVAAGRRFELTMRRSSSATVRIRLSMVTNSGVDNPQCGDHRQIEGHLLRGKEAGA
jgi:hypothetical protein